MSQTRWLRPTAWVLAVVLFIGTLRSVGLTEAWAAVRALTARAIAAMVIVNLAALLLFTMRWWVLLRGLGEHIGIARLVLYRLAGFGFAYFTPGPQVGGEPVQVALLETRHGVARERAIASVLVDRTLEAVVNFGYLAAASVLLLRGSHALLGGEALWVGIFFLLPIAYLVVLAAGHQPIAGGLDAARRFLGRGSRWKDALEIVRVSEYEAGLFCRERRGHLLWAIAISFAGWGSILADYWLMAYFLAMPLSAYQLIAGLTAARLAYLMFLPAGLGVLEAGQVLAIGAMGFPAALGMSLSLLVRARDVLLGSIGLAWGLKALVPLASAPPSAVPPPPPGEKAR